MLKYLILFVVLGSASFAECSCDRSIPVSGNYRIDGPDFSDIITIVVSDGPNGECGGTVDFVHPQAGAHLTCQGNQYFGVIDFMQQPIMLESTSASTVFGTATSFQGVIQRPNMIALVPNEPYTPNFTLTLVSEKTRAPDCMCENVKAWIDSSYSMIQKYSDQTVLEYALQNRLAGLSAGEVAWPNGGVVGAYTTTLSNGNTYQRLVSDQVTQLPNPGEDLVVYLRQEAGTDISNCSFTTGEERTDSGMCRPGIVMAAIAAHESTHSQACQAMNAEKGNPKAFERWVNHPANHAADEIAAYQVTIETLEPWYETNCN